MRIELTKLAHTSLAGFQDQGDANYPLTLHSGDRENRTPKALRLNALAVRLSNQFDSISKWGRQGSNLQTDTVLYPLN